ncbi:hypothetical protein [Lacinutrix mariniflava]|uniref:hypothetical protein n=1 Tax=Lacinutrix mariniflava TaxID=342955 RepID=UPI001F4CAAE4|nr:hypothetical protein [Lacinutrix mariniflava]
MPLPGVNPVVPYSTSHCVAVPKFVQAKSAEVGVILEASNALGAIQVLGQPPLLKLTSSINISLKLAFSSELVKNVHVHYLL